MLKMEIPVIVDNVSESKEGSKNAGYADFMFTGGNVNLPITAEQLKELQGKEGEDVVCLFKMKPTAVVRFNRSVCLFEPKSLLDVIS